MGPPNLPTLADALLQFVQDHRKEINETQFGQVSVQLEIKNFEIVLLRFDRNQTYSRSEVVRAAI